MCDRLWKKRRGGLVREKGKAGVLHGVCGLNEGRKLERSALWTCHNKQEEWIEDGD